MSYKLNANFVPLNEPVNGFIGTANLLIADAIKINGISVFEKDGNYNIQFAGFGEGEGRKSYVVPASKEAYAEILSVIEKAVKDPEHHFGWATGDHFKWNKDQKKFEQMDIIGEAVKEPYADTRFHVEVKGLCTLYGITTQEVEKKGEKGGSFIAVDPPKLDPYEKEGEKVYRPVFEGVVNKSEYNGEKHEFDFGSYLDNAILGKRKDLLNRHPSLDEQVKGAAQKAAQAEAGKEGPAPEHSR